MIYSLGLLDAWRWFLVFLENGRLCLKVRSSTFSQKIASYCLQLQHSLILIVEFISWASEILVFTLLNSAHFSTVKHMFNWNLIPLLFSSHDAEVQEKGQKTVGDKSRQIKNSLQVPFLKAMEMLEISSVEALGKTSWQETDFLGRDTWLKHAFLSPSLSSAVALCSSDSPI